MLDLAELAIEAERLAETVRRARCCDALMPCRRCQGLRRNVIARRLVIAHPRREVRSLHSVQLVAGRGCTSSGAAHLATVSVLAAAPKERVPLAS
jgi:hypothetical protein